MERQLQEKRAKIKEIQENKSLSPLERAKKIQEVMSEKKEEKKEEEIKLPERSFHSKGILGCKHYKRDIQMRAFCCKKFYVCRLCHDDEEEHNIDRFKTEEMICMHCSTVQPISNKCVSEKCRERENLSFYYCDVCKFHSNEEKRPIFHCQPCGICRVGKIGEYEHCFNCEMCFELGHSKECKKKANYKQNCPICTEDLHTSRNTSLVLKCDHVVHKKCLNSFLKKRNYSCPLCKKSMVDMSQQWIFLDQQILLQPMPEIFENTTVEITCCDCNEKSETRFHFLGLKCGKCSSYNTSEIKTNNMPTREQILEFQQQELLQLQAEGGVAEGEEEGEEKDEEE